MDTTLTPSNIMFALGIIGMIFGVYKMFRDPQISLDKQQDLDKQEVDGKASLLEERARWDRENNDGKFKDMGARLDSAFALAQNHTHTVDVKVDRLIESVNAMNIEFTRAFTKITTTMEERFPKK